MIGKKKLGSVLAVLFAFALGFLTAHYLHVAKQMHWIDWLLTATKFGIFGYFVYQAYNHMTISIHLETLAKVDKDEEIKLQHLRQARYMFWQGVVYFVAGVLVLMMVG